LFLAAANSTVFQARFLLIEGLAMKKKIFVDMATYEPALAKLRGMPEIELDIVPTWDEAGKYFPKERIQDVDILFCTRVPINFSDMEKLKLIQISSAGYSQLFGLGLVEKGIRACNARGVFDIPIAEWVIAMIINCARDIRGMIRNQEHGIWDPAAQYQREVRGAVVGFWGYGGIARESARLAKALGMKVHVLVPAGIKRRDNIYCVPGTGDPEGKLPDKVFTPAQKMEFLSGLDFLVLAMTLNKQTEGIIGQQELAALPKGACLLNPARGPLVKEEALLDALRKGHLGAAALDTHYYYPMPADHPLWRFPNVIMTPHISGGALTTHFLDRLWDIFSQNVERFLKGRTLINELTTEQLAG
jgi:phosphoglycerate dehydrogenase-like enzyme